MSAPPPQKPDYVDQAAGKMAQRYGGGKVDANKHGKYIEKVTDFLRKRFESLTGYVLMLYPLLPPSLCVESFL